MEIQPKMTTRDIIKNMSSVELELFIRKRLQYDQHQRSEFRPDENQSSKNQHRRFDMSGYGDDNNSCYIHNFNILNLFRDCGVYDSVSYLYLDAYKGTVTVYYKWFNGDENHQKDFAGCGTVEIISILLQALSINCNKPKRRMN